MLRTAIYRALRDATALLLLDYSHRPVGFNFEALRSGERVRVHFESRGCFHDIKADFLMVRVADGLSVRLTHAHANLVEGKHLEAKTHLDLTALRRLDAGLDGYRRPDGGGCTTVDRLTIEWPNSPIGHRSESIVHGACFFRDDASSFGALLHIVSDSSPSKGG